PSHRGLGRAADPVDAPVLLGVPRARDRRVAARARQAGAAERARRAAGRNAVRLSGPRSPSAAPGCAGHAARLARGPGAPDAPAGRRRIRPGQRRRRQPGALRRRRARGQGQQRVVRPDRAAPDLAHARTVPGALEVKASNASFDRTALLQIGRLRLRLLKEADVSAAYSGLGVARGIARRADNRVLLDAGYIPSLLDVAAAAPLASQLRDVHGLLHQRGDALATQMSQPGPGGIAEIAEFLWLKTINRFEPLFAHLAATTPLHPETLYAACLELAGELSTFTRDSRRPIAYPVYRHDDLAGSFGPVVADIRRSMSMVLERSAVPIELQT